LSMGQKRLAEIQKSIETKNKNWPDLIRYF
jgi:hypothetical protein